MDAPGPRCPASSHTVARLAALLVVCIASASLVANVQDLQISPGIRKPFDGVGLDIIPVRRLEDPSEEEMKDIEAGRAVLEALAPLVLKIDVCNGLTNQRIALIDGIVMGVVLGMQLVLPDELPFNGVELAGVEVDRNMKPVSDMFDIGELRRAVAAIYQSYWCGSRVHEIPATFWCGDGAYPPIIAGAPGGGEGGSTALSIRAAFENVSRVDPLVKLLSMRSRAPQSHFHLSGFRHTLLDTIFRKPGVMEKGYLDAGCTLFRVLVDEADEDIWRVFWRVDDALRFADGIRESARGIMDAIETFRPEAERRSAERGFSAALTPAEVTEPSTRGFNVLHLRAESDWVLHCERWMGLRDGVHRDNCINNTMNVAEVLVSEGLNPRLPLYISSGLSQAELEALSVSGQYGGGFQQLSEAFTVVTKEKILKGALSEDWYTASREHWAAVDFIIAMEARSFVGNSVSTFSAFVMIDRERQGKGAFHYNGGGVPLQDSGFLRPHRSLAVPTFREPLKWVFSIHGGESSLSASFTEMVKVAVLSAKQHTSLVPVCVTTAAPDSEMSTWLVSLGVRVLHHKPEWYDALVAKVRALNSAKTSAGDATDADRSHLYGDPDAMVGTFARIDIPILGILDEYVLYTDVDVMFKSEIDWTTLLGGSQKRLGALRKRVDLAKGRSAFGKSGELGAPLYLAASSEMQRTKDPAFLNAGVMVLNMRSLRDTYAPFRDFILADDDLDWAEGPGDQGAYKAFYADPQTGAPMTSFLPYELNWKTYWPENREAKIVHFHGPKCSRDILPFLTNGTVSVRVFKGLLDQCHSRGDCAALCAEFKGYGEAL